MSLNRFFIHALIVTGTLLIFSCKKSKIPDGAFDILISNAYVIDGTGTEPFSTDILIRGDSIAFIGLVDPGKIEVTEKINADGRVVTPGFIDPHAHGDPVNNGSFENFLSMGVTTISLGQDGFSAEVEDVSKWFSQVDSAGTGVNVLTFIGHSTLRNLSGAKYIPIPTDDQLTKMEYLLLQGLKAGAFGLSTGLEYTPGYYAGAVELLRIAKIAGENDGLIMSHMRNEDNDEIEQSIKELLTQGETAPVHISHFKVVYGKGKGRGLDLLALVDSARSKGIRVTADVYPYTASYTGIGIVFPDWAKAPNNYATVKANRRSELRNYLRDRVNKRNGPDATLFGDGPWRGMTLAQVADSLKISFEDVLMDVVGPEGASGAYFVMDEELQTALLQDSLTCISSDGSPTMHHPRGYGSFAKIIRHYVRETNLLTLPDAIRKMTSLPASILDLDKRGVVKAGNKADLLIFDPANVMDMATYENPHELAQGFDYVIVNGKVAKSDGGIQLTNAGRVLRKR